MNNFSRDMLSRRMMRDGRNPYSSAGGYISRTRPRGRDRASEDMTRGRGRVRDYNMSEDYARNGRMMSRGNDYAYNGDYAEYNRGQDYRDYAENDMGRNSMDYEQSRQSSRDYGYGYGVGMFDYDTEDYADYDMRRDGHYKLSSKDIKKWEKNLENADGTKGKKYDVDQVRQVAQQHGIRFDEYSPELLTAVTNMMYSDYCKVLGGDIMVYVKLAKAFLEDDDFDGEPEEKAMLYYKCIVSKDDD